jgi:hypothetical protein
MSKREKTQDGKAIKNYYLVWKMLLIAVMQEKKGHRNEQEKNVCYYFPYFYLTSMTTYRDVCVCVEVRVHSLYLPVDNWVGN